MGWRDRHQRKSRWDWEQQSPGRRRSLRHVEVPRRQKCCARSVRAAHGRPNDRPGLRGWIRSDISERSLGPVSQLESLVACPRSPTSPAGALRRLRPTATPVQTATTHNARLQRPGVPTSVASAPKLGWLFIVKIRGYWVEFAESDGLKNRRLGGFDGGRLHCFAVEVSV